MQRWIVVPNDQYLSTNGGLRVRLISVRAGFRFGGIRFRPGTLVLVVTYITLTKK